MKFYLSSYELGNETEKLKRLVPRGKIGYIPNALDFTGADPERRQRHIENDMDLLRELSIEVGLLDLRDYFGKGDELKKKLLELGAVFVSGGNTFVLRQAMKLSGFDELLRELRAKDDFLYAGYSAGGCVLAPDLEAYAIVDLPHAPYSELREVIWEGLGFMDYAPMPHWDSDHPESPKIDEAIDYCRQNAIPYKAIRDGEVIIIE